VNRTGALALAAILLWAAPSGCKKAGGSAPAIPFSELREQLTEAHQRLASATAQGTVERVPELDRTIGSTLDAIQARSTSMDLLEREALAIQVASARQCLTALDRYAASGDVDLVAAQLKQLDTVLGEVDTILERAVRVETAK
jgi:hypothetical protein